MTDPSQANELSTRAGAPLEVRIVRDSVGTFTAIEGPLEKLVGWRPEELIGQPSTSFIHPDDQAGAVATWMAMHAAGTPRTWRGRYRTASGSWTWLELENTPGDGVVTTLARSVTGPRLDAERDRTARQEVLNKLADALPVGVFQTGTSGQLVFTNDRLHRIVGTRPAATLEKQLCGVVPEDRPALAAAISAASSGQGIDDLEVRIDVPAEGERVLSISMRPLTDADGGASGLVGCISDVTDRARIRRELEAKATTDALTGCLNRDSIVDGLARTLADPAETRRGVAVMFVDVDDLKLINDRHGHPAGDALLVAAARRLAGAVRGRDRVGRLGGDEFLVVCHDVPDDALAYSIASRMRSAVIGPVDVGTAIVPLSASFGVAWTDKPESIEGLVARADDAMYRRKRGAGRAISAAGESLPPVSAV